MGTVAGQVAAALVTEPPRDFMYYPPERMGGMDNWSYPELEWQTTTLKETRPGVYMARITVSQLGPGTLRVVVR